MELKEIINRQPRIYSTEEMEFLLSEYIKERKGIDVKVNTFKNVPPEFMDFVGHQKLRLLHKAFDYAHDWYLKCTT